MAGQRETAGQEDQKGSRDGKVPMAASQLAALSACTYPAPRPTVPHTPPPCHSPTRPPPQLPHLR